MAKVFALLVCPALLVSCVAAEISPTEPWKTDTELVTPLTSEPDTIDPQRLAFTNEQSVAAMIFEPLLTWDPATLKLMPAAARTLPRVSPDGRVYTYTLRVGLTYSDGLALRAERFVDAFLRLCDPRVAAEYAFLAYPIEGCEAWNTMDPKRVTAEEVARAGDSVGVRAVDELTIEFRLRSPLASFPQTTALVVGAPIRIEEVAGWTDAMRTVKDARRYVGNGPFALKEWLPGDRLVFERNERYRSPVRVARWTKRIVPDADTQRVLYDAGRIDAVDVAPRDAADRDALLARDDMHRVMGPCTIYIGFNTALPPFDDQRVRLAFAKALDKQNYSDVVAKRGHIAFSLVPHAQPGHAHDDRIQAFDAEEARALLASSKYGAPANGLLGGVPIRFPFQPTLAARELALWAADQWQRNLGVRVTPQILPSGWGSSLVKRPEAQPQLYRLAWCEDYPDGQDWYTTVFHSASTVTRTGFRDARFDDLVTRADREHDPIARQDMYEEASRVLSRDAPGAWLMWTEHWWLVRPELRGYELSSFDWEFSQFALARIVGVRR